MLRRWVTHRVGIIVGWPEGFPIQRVIAPRETGFGTVIEVWDAITDKGPRVRILEQLSLQPLRLALVYQHPKLTAVSLTQLSKRGLS